MEPWTSALVGALGLEFIWVNVMYFLDRKIANQNEKIIDEQGIYISNLESIAIDAGYDINAPESIWRGLKCRNNNDVEH